MASTAFGPKNTCAGFPEPLVCISAKTHTFWKGIDMESHISRRQFGKLAAAGALGSGTLLSCSAETPSPATVSAPVQSDLEKKWGIEPGIKMHIGHIRPDNTDEEIMFVKQLGVEYTEFYIPHQVSFYDDLVALKNRMANLGLKIFVVGYDAGNHWYNFTDRIILGQDGRDEDIKNYQRFLADAGRAGMHTVCYGFYNRSGQRTGNITDRGASVTQFDLTKFAPGLSNDREYAEEELWDNYAYAMKQILPAAEDAGVRLSLHPNDPPITLRGVPQIFRNNKTFERMIQITNNSPCAGIEFCVGTWATMASADGGPEDVIGAIKQFGSKIFTVHFRNATGTVPLFNETHIDTGRLDMHEVLSTLKAVGFNGSMEPDHVPAFADEKRFTNKSVVGTAYAIAYTRALLDRVNAEG